MYDPRRTRRGLQEMVPSDLEAVDLTDVDTAFDSYSYHTNMDSSGTGTPFSQSHVDLTQYGSYSVMASDDYTSGMSMSSAQQRSYQTPNSYYHLMRVQPELDLASPTPPTPIPQFQVFKDLLSPTPPTPIPQFQVFDLTCFMEDPQSQQERSTEEPNLVIPEPGSSRSPMSRYTLASPSHEYHDVQAIDYCPQNYSHSNDGDEDEEDLEINTAFMEEEVRESEVVVLSPQVTLSEELEEHSTIDVTDFSASNPTTEEDAPSNSSSGTSSAIDMFASDCFHLPDTCEDHLFDNFCRALKPADTGTVAPSVTKIERDEIRSCGTLPPERPVQQIQTKNKHGKKKKSSDKIASNSRKEAQPKKKEGFQELPALSEDDNARRGRRRSTTIDSNAAVFEEKFLLRNDTKYSDKNCSQTTMGGASASGNISASGKDTVVTVDSILDSVIDRREWMGSFVSGLFDEDQTKAVFYASAIAEAKQKGQPASRGNMVGDFKQVKDYCNFVLQSMDLAEVLENIDAGVYDDELGDFQEDIELCLEAAMDKHDTFMEYENRKWNSKFQNADHSVATKMRHHNLRMLAGEELMKQLDDDFRMQLLDHFCQQISRQQTLHKRQRRVRQ